MNALTAVSKAPGDFHAEVFYNTLAAERDALSQFLRAPLKVEIFEVIALLARQAMPVTFTGIGKSGHIARKAAATFSSLGIPSIFINAAEAAHGDLGTVVPRSCVVALSNSGSSDELPGPCPLAQSTRLRCCGDCRSQGPRLWRGHATT